MNAATLTTAMTTTGADLTFDPPGPGSWTADVDHQAAPRGALMVEVFEPNFTAGSAECFRTYGLPLDRLEGRHVHGWFYTRAVPAGVPDTGGPPPPAKVLKVLTRLVPELRRRTRTAAQTLASQRWLLDARAWTVEREQWRARVDELLAAPLPELDDIALTEHVRRAHHLATDMTRRHFTLLGTAVGIGRLLVAAPRWGLSPVEVAAALRGGSPAAAETRPYLEELASIVGERPGVDSVAALRSLSPRAADLVDEYLHRFGWRPLGGDVEAITLAEHPHRLVELVHAQASTPGHRVADSLEPLRDRVPAGDRPTFARLVEEARECAACQEDNAGMTSAAFGTLRRAVLEIGRRAHARGAIAGVDDVFDLHLDELLELARGGSVDASAVARRRSARAAAATQAPPPHIGAAPTAPPDPSVFPAPLAEVAAAVGAFLSLKFGGPAGPRAAAADPRSAATGSLTVEGFPAVTGTPVVAGSVVGRIVVCADPADALARIEPGDILVCAYTMSAYNAVFPMLAGVVTQFGGPLGHTAIMAREFGIPAVVATGSMPTELDGLQGELSVDTPR